LVHTIVSYDTKTGSVGGAGTTCLAIDGFQLSVAYASLPNKGVVVAQSALNVTSRDIAIQMIKKGATPSAIIQKFQYNMNIDDEQYGIVTSSESKAHTGSINTKWAGDTQGDVNGFKFSFQGNLLTSKKVQSQSYTSFIDNLDEKSASSDRLKKRGCELAWRLFYSLQGGAKNGEGDARCTGRAGTTAFIRVDLNNAQDTGVYFKGKPGEKACSLKKKKLKRKKKKKKKQKKKIKEPEFCDFKQRGYPNAFLSIEIAADGNSDPLKKLKKRFLSWAKKNNCVEK